MTLAESESRRRPAHTVEVLSRSCSFGHQTETGIQRFNLCDEANQPKRNELAELGRIKVSKSALTEAPRLWCNVADAQHPMVIDTHMVSKL